MVDKAPVGSVPENAPEHCPGTASEVAGKAASCQGCPNQQACASAPKVEDPDLAVIEERMRAVRHKILVLSGKGGVGKSTFASQLAFALASHDRSVGLLDIDICGPSIPRMLGLQGEEIHQSGAGWSPVYVEDNLAVMSIGFMLPNQDDAVIWRGPRKNSLIKQFLKDVDWGEMDYLVVDAPPGTSDEHISIAQYLKATQVDGAVIVTTPQEVSLLDVRKEINFCKKKLALSVKKRDLSYFVGDIFCVGIPILGVVENMSGLRQAASELTFKSVNSQGREEDITAKILDLLKQHMGNQAITVETEVFYTNSGGAESMAAKMDVPYLGRIPLDPSLSKAAEEGRSVLASNSSSLAPLQAIINKLKAACGDLANGHSTGVAQKEITMDPLLGSRIHLGF